MAREAAELENVPPQNIDAEQSVLGAMMLDREATAVGLELLRRDDFYRIVHGEIFDAISALFERNEAVDLITMTDELNRRKKLDAVGGAPYLTTLTASVPSTANIQRYCQIVAEKSVLRNLISAAQDITGWAYGEAKPTDEIVDQSEERLFAVTERRISRGFMPLGPLVRDAFDRLDLDTNVEQDYLGTSTGFPDMDAIIGGLSPSTMVIVAARPSMGKTSLAMNIATHVGQRPDASQAVGIFSLEMSKEQLVEAFLSSQAHINSHKLRMGNMSDTDWDKLAVALDQLYESRIFIDDSPALTPLEMRAKARRLKAERGLSLLVVDYLQLVRYPLASDSRFEEVSAIVRSLKGMARELEVPVLVASQLSRNVERREDKRPILSDLMESGYIEAEADVVMFIYRAEYYRYREGAQDGQAGAITSDHTGERQQDPTAPGGDLQRDDTAEIIIAKNRTGPTGVCKLAFRGQYRRFDSLDPRHDSRHAPAG